nr:Crp/Fnr family transcriptional regulator [Sphingomonas beigongshangi]
MPYPIHRYRAFASLTPREEDVLRSLGDTETHRRKGETFQREGDALNGFHLHTSGWIASSITVPSGKRLIQKLHLPGDMLGTPSMALEQAADTLTAVTDATTAFVPYQRVGELFVEAPRLAALFTIAVQMERLSLMDALAVQATASAKERVARLFLDLHARLDPLGLVENDAFDVPVTQEIIGDLLGMTNVHISRTLKALEDAGLVARRRHRLQLLDLPALRALSPLRPRRPQFQPAWLPTAAN